MINREETKKLIKLGSISLVVLIVLGYSAFASHNFILGPEITLSEPENGMTVATSSIKIVGIAHRIKDISLNGRPIIIDNEGNFSEEILLAPGYNVSLLQAQDKFNRTTEYKLELVYVK
jgi:hypothetical protein